MALNISMDGNGYVHADNSYNASNIMSAQTIMRNVANQIEGYDNSQIISLLVNLNALYPQCENFNQFLSEWARVLPMITL